MPSVTGGCQPDQASHTPGHAVAPVREVTSRLAYRACPSTTDRSQAGLLKPLAGEAIDIGQPFVAPRSKTLGSCGVLRHECLAHLRANLEGCRADRRPEPGQ